jgi:D-glycero-D-manno-heptose 1,7-bisphosphate phosphatase
MGIYQMKKAVFLDRDGVINEPIIKNGKPYPPSNMNEFSIPDNVFDILTELKSAGFLLIGATNQPDVARGTTTKQFVESIHARLMTELPLDDILVCYHDDQHQCDCRKPLPGLLIQAAHKYCINLTESVIIGDRWKDIEAGRRAGCKTVWLDFNYQEYFAAHTPNFTTVTLKEAANWILKGT